LKKLNASLDKLIDENGNYEIGRMINEKKKLKKALKDFPGIVEFEFEKKYEWLILIIQGYLKKPINMN